VSKIDLSRYPNNNLLEEDVVHSVEKCFDKNAKIHFHLKMVKVSDILPDKKSKKKAKDDKDRSKTSGLESDSGLDHSGSPLPSQIPNEGSDVHDFTSNSSIPDLSKFDGARSHNGNLGRGQTPDFNMDDSSDGEIQSGLRGRRSRTFDALKNQANSLNEIKDYKGKFIEPALSDITTVNDNTRGDNKKVIELEVKVKNYLRENKELYDKIRENEEEYLSLKEELEDVKLKYDRLNRDYESVLNDKGVQKSAVSGVSKKTEIELKAFKEKVVDLESEVEELKKEKAEAEERADELQQATQDLMAKIEILKKNKKNFSEADNNDKLEEYVNKINDLNQKLKESEKKIKELSSEGKKNGMNKNEFSEFSETEMENTALKAKIEEYEAKVDELEKQLGIQANELQLIKKMNNSRAKNNEESSQFMAQIEQMEKKQKGLEESYKKRIEELTQKNADLKKELGQTKNNMNTSQYDTENELAKLSIENESLKKQIKDMNGKLLNSKYDNKEVEDLRKKLNIIESEKEKLDAELYKAKMGWANADIERDEVKSQLRARDESTKGVKEKSEVLEKEIFRLRSRIAELMNAVMEYGDEDLLDDIETIISKKEDEGTTRGYR